LNTKKQNPNLISLENILEEVETFMFAGHDTTSTTLSWTCQMIGSHPDVQKRLQDEIDSVFGDSNRPVRYEDLKDLTYLENVIKETLRIHASVPFIGRSLSSDIEVGNHLEIKTLLFLIYTIDNFGQKVATNCRKILTCLF
jgi:cytochrome P450